MDGAVGMEEFQTSAVQLSRQVGGSGLKGETLPGPQDDTDETQDTRGKSRGGAPGMPDGADEPSGSAVGLSMKHE